MEQINYPSLIVGLVFGIILGYTFGLTDNRFDPSLTADVNPSESKPVKVVKYVKKNFYKVEDATDNWNKVRFKLSLLDYGYSEPHHYSWEFINMMLAHDLKPGDPPENFMDAFGMPHYVYDVEWHRVEKKKVSAWYLLRHNFHSSTVPEFIKEKLKAKAYKWKNDIYYYPHPKYEGTESLISQP